LIALLPLREQFFLTCSQFANNPSADGVGKYTVFNIKGNAYRLIVEINYRSRRLFLRHVLTHAEYDKGAWKV